MLQPKRTKYRRPHRLSYEGIAKGGDKVDFGEYGLQALEGDYISNHQIEAARIVLARYTKRAGQVWTRIFPHLSRTKKPIGVRMGSGKGNPDSWVAVVKKNRVLFEIGGVAPEIATEALRLAGYKLSIKTRVIAREGKGE